MGLQFLIVDDSPVPRRFICRVIEAGNGKEVLETMFFTTAVGKDEDKEQTPAPGYRWNKSSFVACRWSGAPPASTSTTK